MIEPPPLSRIAGAQCFMPSMAPVRLTAMVRFHASTVVSTMPWRAIVPALLTRMWSLPKCASAAATDLLPGGLVGDVLAQEHDLAALAPEPLRQALARRGIDIGQHHRAPLRAAKSSASAVPCPPAAPVISATLPVNRAISSPPVY